MQKLCAFVCVLAFAVPTFAQDRREKGWLDVNFGVATAAEDSITTSTDIPQNEEIGTYRVDYTFPRGASFDFGGGVMFSPILGAGVSIVGTATEAPAELFVRIPHPLRFNAFGTDTSETDGKLARTEGTINLQLMLKAPIQNEKVRVRFFAGPSYFRLTADAVSDIRYRQNYAILGTTNIVNIEEYDVEEVEATGWGFHAGGDVSFMFTRVFGIGGFARFSRGTVTIEDDEVLTVDEPLDVKVGGLQAGVGIRLRF
jgi:hypothetical protein